MNAFLLCAKLSNENIKEAKQVEKPNAINITKIIKLIYIAGSFTCTPDDSINSVIKNCTANINHEINEYFNCRFAFFLKLKLLNINNIFTITF